MNDNRKNDLIYAINSNFFSRTFSLTSQIRVTISNLIQVGKSNGPNEVWKSILCGISKGKVKIVNSDKRTWPSSYSNVIIVKDFIYNIPQELLNKLNKSHLLLGPNIDFMLEDNYKYLNFFENKKILVPCDWVKTFFIKKFKMSPQSIEVWSSGVDINYWAPHLYKKKEKKNTVIIYQKSTKLANLVNQYYILLKDLGFTPVVLKYGEYKQYKYRHYLDKSRFLVWLGGTESQSFAQFQAWAMDVPTLILEVNEYIDDQIRYEASSSPYLTTQTGAFFLQNSSIKETLELWLERINTFRPRNWVLNGHKDSDAVIQLQKIYDNWQS